MRQGRFFFFLKVKMPVKLITCSFPIRDEGSLVLMGTGPVDFCTKLHWIKQVDKLFSTRP